MRRKENVLVSVRVKVVDGANTVNFGWSRQPMGQSEEAELNELMAAIRNLSLNMCIKITDRYLDHVIVKCSGLKSLNFYALSRYGVDCAILIIDSTTGGFEAGIQKTDTPVNMLFLLLPLVSSKMDTTTPKYSKARCDEIVK
ncbi:putative protein-synthesizing GTPase [Helianthus anomalus]